MSKVSVRDKSADRKVTRPQLFLIFGFLGSGKTTLIKNIFSWEWDLTGTVVMVNELGRVGLDGMILGEGPLPVVELTNGCICCSMRAELVVSLKEVIEAFSPQRIFVEATGIADPREVLGVLRPVVEEGSTKVAKVICVLDSELWQAREMLGPVFFNQIGAADLVLLNKIDQFDGEQVPLFLSQIHAEFPESKVIPTFYCRIDPFTFLAEEQEAESTKKLASFFAGSPLREAKGVDFITFSFESEKCFREECFQRFLESLPFEVFRVKGLVRFPGKTRILNYVGGKAEWQEREGYTPTRLDIIGWNVSPEVYIRQMEACL